MSLVTKVTSFLRSNKAPRPPINHINSIHESQISSPHHELYLPNTSPVDNTACSPSSCLKEL